MCKVEKMLKKIILKRRNQNFKSAKIFRRQVTTSHTAVLSYDLTAMGFPVVSFLLEGIETCRIFYELVKKNRELNFSVILKLF